MYIKNYLLKNYKSNLINWQDSIYTYNFSNLNIINYYKNKNVFILLDNYFNMKNKININKYKYLLKLNFNFKNIKYKYIICTINKIYNYSLINKQFTYMMKRKNKLISWKNKLILNKNIFSISKKSISYVSLNRIFLNSYNIKHTNNIVNIILFIFNKNKIYLKNKLNKLNKIIKNTRTNIHSNIIVNNINEYKNSYLYFLRLILKSIIIDIININKYRSISKIKYKNMIKIKKNVLLLKKNYIAYLYLNNYKFNYLNIINIKNLINKIYNKKIKINFINIKNIYVDNNIFINSIIRKLNDRKKRVLKIFKKGLSIAKIGKIKTIYTKNYIRNIKKNNIINIIKYNNYINYIYKYYYNKYELIIKNMKNIHIVGISMEGKGRLTRRLTASRSIYKIRTNGFIKNIYSSMYGVSMLLTRGSKSSNNRYIQNNSYNRNGSYGISINTNTY